MPVPREKLAGGLLEVLHRSSEKYGHCDPLWFRAKRHPEINAVIGEAGGPPMILLHGLFGALSNWDAVSPKFAKFLQPIALHFPLLTAHRSEVKIKSLALLTEYYIRRENIAPVIACGNSLGGHVALRLCLAAPELVDCLILTGTSGLYEHTVDTLPVRPNHTFVRDQMSRVFYDQSFVSDAAVNEISQILEDRVRVLNLIHAARSAKRDNLQKVLGEIKVPTLLLWGEDDKVTTMEVARQFHDLIPNSELITIKNCGHAPMIEHPEWFAETVHAFVKEHSKTFKKVKDATPIVE